MYCYASRVDRCDSGWCNYYSILVRVLQNIAKESGFPSACFSGKENVSLRIVYEFCSKRSRIGSLSGIGLRIHVFNAKRCVNELDYL